MARFLADFLHRLSVVLLASQQSLCLCSEWQPFVGVGLLLVEFQDKMLAVSLHVLPFQGFDIAETDSRQAGEQEHRLDIVVLV